MSERRARPRGEGRADGRGAGGAQHDHVTYNGPLFARGELAIEGAPDDMPAVRFRAALCRCGQSKNKPFCDGSHKAAGFQAG